MALGNWSFFSRRINKSTSRTQRGPHRSPPDVRRRLRLEQLEDRMVPSGVNPNQIINTGLSPVDLAQSLVGPGVSVSNVQFTGGAASTGSFSFTDPTVVGFSQGILLSSGSAADVVGPNLSDWNSTDFALPGDPNLDALSGYPTYDAAVLEFDFVPSANQVVFQYTFASDEYPEWVNTPYNDVFAFYVNGVNYAEVRQIAGDPLAPFVPVAVNNINHGNALYPDYIAMRPDLFRENYFNAGSPTTHDLELDGITSVLTFQAPVNPGVANHMKLAIADASDGIYDSAVFIQAGSLVSNENPVADLSVTPERGAGPLLVTAFIEGEDPNGLPLTYTINWGDGTTSTGPLNDPVGDSEKTAQVDHTYTVAGGYLVTLTVSNGSLSGTSIEDVEVLPGAGALFVTGNPTDQNVLDGELFVFSASAAGATSVQWQVSIDSGATFSDIAGATANVYSGTASLADNGNLYYAVFSDGTDSVITTAALLSVSTGGTTTLAPPVVALAHDTGSDPTDLITSVADLSVTGIEVDADVEYSLDGTDWSGAFNAVEGVNTVLVRQVLGNDASDATTFTFTLDTMAPAAPSAALAQDTGAAAADGITQVGLLSLAGLEAETAVEYSVDGGLTWSSDFIPAEGLNTALVRQTDLAGNASNAAAVNFTLDTTAPAAPGIALAEDTGSDPADAITKVGDLVVSGAELGALVEYSNDGGATWAGSFTPVEGVNSVLVRQTDVAGNVGNATAFSFTLDTTAPTLSPAFSAPQPFLVGAAGITVSANASDAWGIASQTGGAVDTATPGAKVVICTASDLAGNSASVNVPYVVGYSALSVAPLAGKTFKRKALIPVSFQLADALGVISDQAAAALAPRIRVSLDGLPSVGVSYSKATNRFKATVKASLLAGNYNILIRVTIDGIDVTTVTIPVIVQ